MAWIIDTVNALVWSPALVFLCLACGLYFSIRTRFVQLRYLPQMWRLIWEGKSSEAGVSSFEAISMTLAGRVGTGNIAGVATAITFGGPGAVFWMWVVAFLGASSAFIESTLGQIYKSKIGGQYRGGPAFYIDKGLGMKKFAILFALVTLFACGVLMPGVQANTIGVSFSTALAVSPWISALLLGVLLAFIIWGGVKRIASFSAKVVPFMALAYVLLALVIVTMNITEIPRVLALIFRSALGFDAGFGAILGLAIMWGVKRGIYSNEAGQGTGAHAASAAEVSHPAKQGLVQAFSVYIDTMLICSATAFMLLAPGLYNVEAADGSLLYSGMAGIAAGPGYVQAAMENLLPGVGAIFVAVSLFFFAFTTIVAYYYIAESNIAYLCRQQERPWLVNLLRGTIIITVMYGTINTAEQSWALGDIGVGLMAWLNLIAIILLSKPALRCLDDFERQSRLGQDPQFDPRPLEIENADYWYQRAVLLEQQPLAELTSGQEKPLPAEQG